MAVRENAVVDVPRGIDKASCIEVESDSCPLPFSLSILPVPETLRGKIQEEETRKSLMDFLELIKDTMDVLMRYAAYSTASACSFMKFRLHFELKKYDYRLLPTKPV